MTSTLEVSGAVDGEIFKRDKMGRVRVPRARREALLNEFERGGTSGAQFAEYVGIKYSTFANWIQKRQRRQRSRSWNCPSEPGDKNQENGPGSMVGNDGRWGRTGVADRSEVAGAFAGRRPS